MLATYHTCMIHSYHTHYIYDLTIYAYNMELAIVPYEYMEQLQLMYILW